MHLHRPYTTYIWWSVLVVLIVFLSIFWRRERKYISTTHAYQLQLNQLQALTLEIATQSGNDALLQQTFSKLQDTTQQLLASLPDAQKDGWSATQIAALQLNSWQQTAWANTYTQITRRVQLLFAQPFFTPERISEALLLRQNYEQLALSDQTAAQHTHILHNQIVFEQLLQLRVRQMIITQTTTTDNALAQANNAIHALLSESKWLITFLEQAQIVGTEKAPQEDLLACRTNLLQALRREQKEAVAVMTMLTLAQETQQGILQQCMQQREDCVSHTQRNARHTWLQNVSSGVVAVAEKYSKLHTLWSQGAPLDASQLCVRRNKLPQTTTDLQNDLERALEQREQLTKPQWSTGTVLDQSGSAGNEKLFDDRQENAMQDIEQRQQQRLQETESSSGDTFRERLHKFFEQFDGNW